MKYLIIDVKYYKARIIPLLNRYKRIASFINDSSITNIMLRLDWDSHWLSLLDQEAIENAVIASGWSVEEIEDIKIYIQNV